MLFERSSLKGVHKLQIFQGNKDKQEVQIISNSQLTSERPTLDIDLVIQWKYKIGDRVSDQKK